MITDGNRKLVICISSIIKGKLTPNLTYGKAYVVDIIDIGPYNDQDYIYWITSDIGSYIRYDVINFEKNFISVDEFRNNQIDICINLT